MNGLKVITNLEIQMQKKNVILIGNKCDLVDEREVINEEIEKFIKDNDIHYFETSAQEVKILMKAFILLLKD